MKRKHHKSFTNLSGQTFQDYTVIEFGEVKKTEGGENYYWLCECVCGTRKLVSTSNLRNEKTRGCGCKHTRRKDLTGEKAGEWTVDSFAYKRRNHVYWKLLNEKAEVKYMSASNFRRLQSCLAREGD